jgi:hypothetical protein
MKRWVAGLAAVVFLGVAAGAMGGEGKEVTKKKNPNIGRVRHVVLFKFKDDAPAAEVKKIEDAFRQLPKKIPEILAYEWGTNNSPEKLDNGFTHCFFLTFKDEAARDKYLPHPDHKAFGKLLGPYLDKVLVVDYVAKE